MTFVIRRFLIIFIIIEITVFLILYCFGPNSLKTLYDLKNCKKQTCNNIVQLQEDIQSLQREFENSATPFAKEKIARERLFMKKPEETIYLKKT